MKCLNIAIFCLNPAAAHNNASLQASLQLLRMLGLRGHRFTFYHPDIFGRRMIWEFSENEQVRTVHYPLNGYTGIFECLEEAAENDVLIKTCGVGPFDRLLDQALLEVRRPGGAIAAQLDLDPQTTLDRLRQHPEDPLYRLIPGYDLILTSGGGMGFVRAWLSLGARQCMQLWSLLRPATHELVPPAEGSFSQRMTAPISMGHLEALEFSFFQALSRVQAPEHHEAVAV